MSFFVRALEALGEHRAREERDLVTAVRLAVWGSDDAIDRLHRQADPHCPPDTP